MRAKERKTEWYFDIINPVLAEICRKNKIAVYVTGNMVQSKGNMPYSMGNGWVREPRFVELRKGCAPNNPRGDSIARWFVEMGKCAGILNDKVAQNIMDFANLIDGYTYHYEIEHTHVDPDTFGSFISIEKRLWNECVQYGFTESEFDEYRKELRKGTVPSELRFLICDDSEKEPLCERLNEGVGMRNPTSVGDCMLTTQFFSPYDQYTNDGLRKIMEEKGGTNCAVSKKCTIPFIESSNKISVGLSGTHFSLTSISGKSKTAITEFIKRNGGKIVTEYNPKTMVFIAKNIAEQEFIEENKKEIKYVHRIVTNPLLNGLARKALGDKVHIILEQDFLNAYNQEDFKTDPAPQDLTYDEQGNLLMTMAQAEAVWTVKSLKSGISVAGYVGNDETLVVPSYIDGKPVVTVDKGKKNSNVRKIVIPATVKKINTGAFPKYEKLEEIVFKGKETVVGTASFSGCPLLYDENNCIIANGVLQDCNQEGDIVVPGDAKIIPNDFVKKSSIKQANTVTFQDGVEELGWSVFKECTTLKKIVIGNTVKTIWNGAFMDCTALEEVEIGDSIKEIKYVAFSHCENLKKITIGRSLKRIEKYAFGYCKSLEDIYYNGTIKEWNSVRTELYWDSGTGNYIIHCIDGDIAKRS